METILQMVMEGVCGCEGTLDVCREHLGQFVGKGVLGEAELEDLLGKIRRSLLLRRRALLEKARMELQLFLEGSPLMTEESFRILEDRVMPLDPGTGGERANF